MTVLERLEKQILYFDGGTGSLLQARGLKPGELPETWNILHPEIVTGLHSEYLAAGCHILKSNTFGANALKYTGTPYSVEAIVTAAIGNARKAIADSGRDDAYVALDMGPTGKILEPFGDLPFERAVSLYAEVVKAGVKAGADLILIETMSDTYELKAAVLAAKENSGLPIFTTVTLDEHGKLLTGADIPAVVALLEGLHVDAIGMNCGLGPKQMLPLVKDFLEYSSLPVIVNPNAGLPHIENGKAVYDIDADTFSEFATEFLSLGARIVGGCCGTTPDHIARTAALSREMQPVPVTFKSRVLVSSYNHAIDMNTNPVIGSLSSLVQALNDGDAEYVLDEALDLQDDGAQILEIDFSLPGIHKTDSLLSVIRDLQEIISLPLKITASDPSILSQAVRIYNGNPLTCLVSVTENINYEEESFEL